MYIDFFMNTLIVTGFILGIGLTLKIWAYFISKGWSMGKDRTWQDRCLPNIYLELVKETKKGKKSEKTSKRKG